MRLVTHGCSLKYLYNEMSATATTTTLQKSTKATAEEDTATSTATLSIETVTETKTRTCNYNPIKNAKSMETSTLLAEESLSLAKSKGTATNDKHALPQLRVFNERQSQTQNQHVLEQKLQFPTTFTPSNNVPKHHSSSPTNLTQRPSSFYFSSSTITPSPLLTSLKGISTPTQYIKTPLFEVRLELLGMQISFQPTFELNVENNFQQIVEQLLHDINTASNCMPRIFRNESATLSSDDECGDILVQHTNETQLIHGESQQQLEIETVEKQENAAERKENGKTEIPSIANKRFSTTTAKGIISFDFSLKIVEIPFIASYLLFLYVLLLYSKNVISIRDSL